MPYPSSPAGGSPAARSGATVPPTAAAPARLPSRYRDLAELRDLLPDGIITQVFDHWLAVRGEAVAPPRRAITPDAIVRSLPYLFINEHCPAATAGDRDDYTVRLAGTALRSLYGRDVTGCRISGLFAGSMAADALAEHDAVRMTAMPHLLTARFPNHHGSVVEYVRLLMPLSDDGRQVNRLLGVFQVDTPDQIALPPLYSLMASVLGETENRHVVPA